MVEASMDVCQQVHDHGDFVNDQYFQAGIFDTQSIELVLTQQRVRKADVLADAKCGVDCWSAQIVGDSACRSHDQDGDIVKVQSHWCQ